MADVVVTMESDVAKLIRDQQRAIRKQDEMIAKLRQTQRVGRQASTAAERSAKSSAAAASSSVSSMSALVARASTAITVVAGAAGVALRAMRQEAEQAGQAITEAESGLAQLAQLADSPQSFVRLTRSAREVFSAGGAPTLGEAGRLAFALQSAGATTPEQVRLFSQLGGTRLVDDPAAFAKAAKTLISTLGTEETGGFRPLTSKAFGASLFSPSTAPAILEATARSGAAARVLGISDEELLAANALLSEAKGSAEEGGTRVAALARSLTKNPSLFRGNIESTVLELGKQDPASLFKTLGRAEAVETVQVLSANIERFREARAAIADAERTDAVSTKLQLAQADPAVRAAQEARIAESRQQLASAPVGIASRTVDEIIANRISSIRSGGGGALNEANVQLQRFAFWLARLTAGDEALLQARVATRGFIGGGSLDAESQNAAAGLEAIREMRAAATELRRAARAQRPGFSQPSRAQASQQQE